VVKHAFLIVLFVSFSQALSAQNDKEKNKQNNLIQFAGEVLDVDSLTPIPFVSIAVNGKPRANSDFYGFFSLVVQPGDEIKFISLAHKNRTYMIPDTLKQKYYWAVQVLTKDTIQLPPVEVFPWPTREEFKKAFLSLNLKDTDIDRAEKNLQRDAQSYLERNQTTSASENYKYVMLAYYTRAYTMGQQPSISLLSPIAWATFIDNIKKGKYNDKKKKKD
jgi:hypothetical protein